MDDDLLADLDELGGSDDDELEEMDSRDRLAQEALMASIADASDVRNLLKIYNSKQLQDLRLRIDGFLRSDRMTDAAVEDDPEYPVIVQANNLSVGLENEIAIVHKFIRDHYAPRFPELESLILNPIDYAKAVKMIGNEEDLTAVDLKSFLPSATVMVVTVTATTTNGRILDGAELERVFTGCDIAIELEAARLAIVGYVEQRMGLVAPNITAIIGSATAAKLMGHSGGLKALSKIPACNIIVLGAQKKTSLGLSSISTGRHIGFIYACDLISQTPQEFRRKAARIVSAKVALAARVDFARQRQDGSIGKMYREDIEKKIDLLTQPPPGKKTKALPVPLEEPTKRRGGRRARKAKERLAQTEVRKAQNRMAFGEAEEEIFVDGDETIGLGMIGKQQGRVRSAPIDTRVKVNMSKRHKAFHSNVTQSASSSTVSGLSSSVAFTPVKGIELENPELVAQRKNAAATSKYFGTPVFRKPTSS